MALRVLLADESVTIKKVFQLSLQDYAADVVTVTVGVDVLPVAKKTKPDIIFADVLLQKKNGYEVAAEIKKDPMLSKIPVVLIWSGFMELDEARFKASRADGHLEKPFDTQKLRQLVQTLVPKTQTQTLSEYLQFPKLPDFAESPAPTDAEAKPAEPDKPAAKPAPTNVIPLNDEEKDSNWSMDSFEPLQVPDDEIDEFVAVDLPPAPPPAKAAGKPETEPDLDDDGDNQWIQRTLSNYKVQPPQPEDEEVDFGLPDPDTIIRNEMTSTRAAAKAPTPAVEDDIELDLSDAPAPRPEPIPQLNDKQLEAIIRAQSKEVIEKVVWQVVPEIATQIIERELQKLLKERDELGPR